MEFTSLGTFADAMGTGVATDYMSVRTAAHGTRGWMTHAITPPQQPMSFNAATGAREPLYEGEFTPDLQGGVFLGSSPVTDAPNVANVANLYLRTDLRTAGAGSYQLISACPLCDLTSTPVPPMTPEVQPLPIQLVAGVSADLSHVPFESKLPLTVGRLGWPRACPSSTRGGTARERPPERVAGEQRVRWQAPARAARVSWRTPPTFC